jgi:DNA polymerase phi
MAALKQSIQHAVRDACLDEETLSAAHVKQVLKLALSAARQTRRLLASSQPSPSQTELRAIWEPDSWDALGTVLEGSDRFKASTGLRALCKQIARVCSDQMDESSAAKKGKKYKKQPEDNEESKSKKRKVEDVVDSSEDATVAKKKAGRKVKKAKA